ncbi:MAG: DUF1566 domain-containing protein [Tatlockia sp.]|jgi:hypothetical protein
MKLTRGISQLGVVLSAFCLISTAYAAYPLWVFTPNPNFPPKISIHSTQTATVVYSVQNQSNKAKSLVMQSIAGVVQSLPCQLTPFGQPGSSCSLVLAVSGNALPKEGVHNGPILCEANSYGVPNPNQCYRPGAADNLNITLTNPTVGVTIRVDPFILLIAEHSTGIVTVTNSTSSSASAKNVTATIPGTSGMSIQSTTCTSSLGIGASCTITFASSTQEGPTLIPIKGDNTNTANVYAAVTDQPLIRITGPVLQSRIVDTNGVSTLDLEVTNDLDSLFNANNISVTDKASCPDLSVDASNCISLAPGASCLLALTTTTPYAPCTITISGSNTANSPTTLIAFSHLGGLVFQKSGANGKVVIDAGSEFTSEWTFPSKADIPGAMSDDNGVSNTDAIVVNPACLNQSGNCAAFRCRAISADWYLPAKNEMQAVVFALCPGSIYPCAFGAFSSTFYWSSTQWFAPTNAYTVDVPDGNFGPTDKWGSHPVRCIRDF